MGIKYFQLIRGGELGMLSYKLKEKLSPLFSGVSEKNFFTDELIPAWGVISLLSRQYDEAISKMPAVVSGDSNAWQSMRNVVGSTASVLRKTSPREFFLSYERLVSVVSGLQMADLSDSVEVNFKDDLDDFGLAYDFFLSNPGAENAWPLISSAHLIHGRLLALWAGLSFVYQGIDNFSVELEGSGGDIYSEFYFLLTPTDRYVDVLCRLNAIQGIYDALCNLLGVNSSEHGLRVKKIETGSLWVMLFGESRVVSLLVKFVEGAAGYIYRNYTLEGKISAIPRGVQALDSVIGLRESLRGLGIDTGAIDENINNASVGISKNLTKLLDRQSSVEINGKILSVGEGALRIRFESDAGRKLGFIENDVDEEKGVGEGLSPPVEE